MKTADFDYHLPEECIAQAPVEPRDASRLLVLPREGGEISHAVFNQLGEYLHPGDVLVLNQTRVIPARLAGRKIPSGGRVEILLLSRRDAETWEALVGGKGLVSGKWVEVEHGPRAQILADLGGSRRLVHFELPVESWLPGAGVMPLPPYIKQALHDPERYQTVYASQSGSAAAPTAGLHFTPHLLQQLEQQGVRLAWVTLHVGLDTFLPVTEQEPQEHQIHSEWCQVPAQTACLVNEAQRNGGRVVAVGTTSVRSLESAAQAAPPGKRVVEYAGSTGLFILPGYQFRAIDAMITNFHLPKSTLIMMVSAFAGRERILSAYQAAVALGYRFYSFGDAMLIQ